MSCDWIRFKQAESSLMRNVGTEVIVTRPFSNRVEGLSGSAGAIWSRLATPVTLPELVSDVSTMYHVATEEIEDDVKALLENLIHLHLVEEVALASD
jgi:hypothetical protein